MLGIVWKGHIPFRSVLPALWLKCCFCEYTVLLQISMIMNKGLDVNRDKDEKQAVLPTRICRNFICIKCYRNYSTILPRSQLTLMCPLTIKYLNFDRNLPKAYIKLHQQWECQADSFLPPSRYFCLGLFCFILMILHFGKQHTLKYICSGVARKLFWGLVLLQSSWVTLANSPLSVFPSLIQE